jgi:fatty-acyl-CoA synthase
MDPASAATDEELRASALGRLARFKAPRAFVRVDRVQRTATGKPDYPWAKEMAEKG